MLQLFICQTSCTTVSPHPVSSETPPAPALSKGLISIICHRTGKVIWHFNVFQQLFSVQFQLKFLNVLLFCDYTDATVMLGVHFVTNEYNGERQAKLKVREYLHLFVVCCNSKSSMNL